MPTDTLTLADAFLADILTAPADDAPRLIFADWLADNGEEARGEFIRVQCELARVDREVESLGKCHCGDSGDPTGCSRCREGKRRGLWKKRECLRRREGEILLVGGHWYGRWHAWLDIPPLLAPERFTLWQRDGDFVGSSSIGLRWTRGFVSHVCCPQNVWLEHGSAFLRKCPVTRVDLTDKEVWAGRGAPTDSVAWLRHGYDVNTANMVRHTLDYRLFRKLAVGTVKRSRNIRWYLTPDDATADLSQACLRYARETHP